MRIPTLNTRSTAPRLPSDMAINIRAHRDLGTHRRIVDLYRTQRPLCERCGHEGRIQAGAEVHHIQPVARGGATTNDNLLHLCLPCHLTIDQVPQDEQRAMKEST